VDLAGRVDVGAEALGGIVRARDVVHARVVGDVPDPLHELVHARVRSPVARSRVLRPAVQNELDGQIDVIPLRQASDLLRTKGGVVRDGKRAIAILPNSSIPAGPVP
jgi:hypothetical protein